VKVKVLTKINPSKESVVVTVSTKGKVGSTSGDLGFNERELNGGAASSVLEKVRMEIHLMDQNTYPALTNAQRSA
jgi:hypothetical protein